MREIRFRAWTLDKKMKYGVVLLGSELILGDNGPYGVPNQPAKVMQFTGLKDINRKEIYEGDLVRILDTDIINEVIYERGFFSPVAGFDTENTIEVVGNIYQNPELVKNEG